MKHTECLSPAAGGIHIVYVYISICVCFARDGNWLFVFVLCFLPGLVCVAGYMHIYAYAYAHRYKYTHAYICTVCMCNLLRIHIQSCFWLNLAMQSCNSLDLDFQICQLLMNITGKNTDSQSSIRHYSS